MTNPTELKRLFETLRDKYPQAIIGSAALTTVLPFISAARMTSGIEQVIADAIAGTLGLIGVLGYAMALFRANRSQ